MIRSRSRLTYFKNVFSYFYFSAPGSLEFIHCPTFISRKKLWIRNSVSLDNRTVFLLYKTPKKKNLIKRLFFYSLSWNINPKVTSFNVRLTNSAFFNKIATHFFYTKFLFFSLVISFYSSIQEMWYLFKNNLYIKPDNLNSKQKKLINKASAQALQIWFDSMVGLKHGVSFSTFFSLSLLKFNNIIFNNVNVFKSRKSLVLRLPINNVFKQKQGSILLITNLITVNLNLASRLVLRYKFTTGLGNKY